MRKEKTRTIPFRRVREGKTNYKKRLKLLLNNKPRVVVRRSSKHIKGQFIEFSCEGDKVVFVAESKELKRFGWKGSLNNRSAAYLTGFLLSKKIGKKDVVFDIGVQMSIKGNVIYSFAKGCLDGGLKFSCSKDMFPSEDIITGKNIVDYARLLKKDKEKFEKQFGNIRKDIDPEKICEHFMEVKKKIIEK